jgi:hypothetical protein
MLGISLLYKLRVGPQRKDPFVDGLCLQFIHQFFGSQCQYIFPLKKQKGVYL